LCCGFQRRSPLENDRGFETASLSEATKVCGKKGSFGVLKDFEGIARFYRANACIFFKIRAWESPPIVRTVKQQRVFET